MAYIDIHTHTEYSLLDGLSTCKEAVARAVENGAPALIVTDHGNCAAHPQFQHECLQAGLRPGFGMEAYFRKNRLIRPAEGDEAARKQLIRGEHLILIAQGDRGLHDLWAASTEAYATGHYGKPRVDYDVLEEYGSDLMATTSCLGGIISQDLLQGRYDEAWAKLDRFKSIFKDRLWLEIQANDQPDQIRLNQLLAMVSEDFGIPLVAASDAHYPSEEDHTLHKWWMRCQSGKGKDDYWHFSAMLGEQRVREMLGYLDPKVVDAAIRATTEIADRCTARIGGVAEPPVFTPGGTHEDDARRLWQLCEQNWGRIKNPTREYRDRLEYEFKIVTDKNFAGCYLIVEDIVRWVRGQGWLAGPGRGSAAGSLMSYLCDITSIDPLRAGLMFERFLTPGRAAMPDFDMDFASSKRGPIQDYAITKYGADHVVRVGTIMRYGAKGILDKLFSVMAKQLPEEAQADSRVIAGLIDDAEMGTAGLGLPWEEIMEDPAIAEYAVKYKLVFQLARHLVGRVYSQGQHPAGLVISPDRLLAGTMPMRLAETSKTLLVSQFDYRAIEALGWLKLDFLTLRNLESVQEAIDLIAARTGVVLDPRSWDIEHEDPQVYDEIGTGETRIMFQIETDLCKDYCRRMRPRTVGDLSDLTTIIRPGPRNSGAAEKYLLRRAGMEPVTYPHPMLEEDLRDSYGLLVYQEHVLGACKKLAGYDDLRADGVRKILGKKLTDKVAAAGEEFVEACVARGHDRAQIEALWADIAEFGKYAFNRAHAYSYATLSYWTAWLKVHYPVEMFTGVLSTIGKMDRMAAIATDARRMGIQVLPPDVRFCGAGFTAEGLSIRYGLSAIPKVGEAAVRSIVRSQPYHSYEDFKGRSGVNAGVLLALARAGALDALVPSRKGVLQVIEADRDGSSVTCIHKDPEAIGPNRLPCTYDWAGEPQELPRIGKRGLPLKVNVKPPPAKCFKGCRRYTPPPRADLAAFGEFRPDAKFRQDLEVYGTWMADDVFAQLEQLGDGMRDRTRRMALMVQGAPEGTYPLAAVYARTDTARTRAGNTMYWVTLMTEVSSFSLACFNPRHDDEPDLPAVLRGLRSGTLVSAEVVRRSYQVPGRGTRMGWRLADIWPIGA